MDEYDRNNQEPRSGTADSYEMTEDQLTGDAEAFRACAES